MSIASREWEAFLDREPCRAEVEAAIRERLSVLAPAVIGSEDRMTPEEFEAAVMEPFPDKAEWSASVESEDESGGRAHAQTADPFEKYGGPPMFQ